MPGCISVNYLFILACLVSFAGGYVLALINCGDHNYPTHCVEDGIE